jgi:hypothetical protein
MVIGAAILSISGKGLKESIVVKMDVMVVAYIH